MTIPSRDRRDPGRSNPVLRHIKPAGPAGAETFAAVVHAPDGIRLAAMADSRAELVRRLAEYVRCDVGAALDAVAATPGSALRSREA